MIGGNTTAQIQTCTIRKNAIGEGEKTWKPAQNIIGFLDLSSGDSSYTTYDAKIQESTHVFISDWHSLNASIRAENSRMIINNQIYDIKLIDDPMGLHKQLEFYLQHKGGCNNGSAI